MHRLLDKFLNDIIFIHGDNATSSGVGHRIDAQRSRKIFLAMEFKHPPQVHARKHIAIKDKKRFFSSDERAILRQRSGATQQLRLLHNARSHSALLRRDKLLDRLRMSVRIHQNVSDSRGLAIIKPDFK